jgi:hypothetical protein
MAETQPQHPDWAQPGARVVIVTTSGYGQERVVFDRIARLTATQLVTEGDRRFRPAPGGYVGLPRFSSDRLYAWDDDAAVKARARAAVRSYLAKLKREVQEQAANHPFDIDGSHRLVNLAERLHEATARCAQLHAS